MGFTVLYLYWISYWRSLIDMCMILLELNTALYIKPYTTPAIVCAHQWNILDTWLIIMTILNSSAMVIVHLQSNIAFNCLFIPIYVPYSLKTMITHYWSCAVCAMRSRHITKILQFVYWCFNRRADPCISVDSASMPGSDLPLWDQYTTCSASLGSNHCFQAFWTYMNYSMEVNDYEAQILTHLDYISFVLVIFLQRGGDDSSRCWYFGNQADVKVQMSCNFPSYRCRWWDPVSVQWRTWSHHIKTMENTIRCQSNPVCQWWRYTYLLAVQPWDRNHLFDNWTWSGGRGRPCNTPVFCKRHLSVCIKAKPPECGVAWHRNTCGFDLRSQP